MISLSQAGVGSMPDDWEDESDDRETRRKAEAEEDEQEDALLDWTIVLRDVDGAEAGLPLSYDHALYPLVSAVPRRASFLDDNDPTEVLFRSYAFPLEAFSAANPSFDADSIATISFVFDGSEKGAIIMEDMSIRAGHQPLRDARAGSVE
jgi:hypothetical protein